MSISSEEFLNECLQYQLGISKEEIDYEIFLHQFEEFEESQKRLKCQSCNSEDIVDEAVKYVCQECGYFWY